MGRQDRDLVTTGNEAARQIPDEGPGGISIETGIRLSEK